MVTDLFLEPFRYCPEVLGESTELLTVKGPIFRKVNKTL